MISCKMLTALQTTAFFETAAQMGVSHRTRMHLQDEGIVDPEDLRDFVLDSSWDQIVGNCKRPGQIMAGVPAVLTNQAAFLLPAKALMRLQTAARVIDYYLKTDRPLLAANLAWDRLRNFKEEMEMIDQMKKDNSNLELPVISKTLSIVKFLEAYNNYLSDYIGVSGAPLSWIVRTDAAVNATAPPLEALQPYSTLHGSVAQEMVNRLPHIGAIYNADNATVYSQLVTATLGTQYAPTISTFRRQKKGREALDALESQFAGPDYWDNQVKIYEVILRDNTWHGRSGMTMQAFVTRH